MGAAVGIVMRYGAVGMLKRCMISYCEDVGAAFGWYVCVVR